MSSKRESQPRRHGSPSPRKGGARELAATVLLALLATGDVARADEMAATESLTLASTAPSPSTTPSAQAVASAAEEFATLSLEDLMDIEITSVSKQRQRIAEAPAAVYVITDEDIRRSGMSSIPELLRLSPGLNVAQISANRWAISSRGFNEAFGNKLLVLMDGRTIYTPLFAGVFWDAQDYILQDLDRIEVVRGPGGTLWGANAVNGVINIISKDASLTQGLLLTGEYGNYDQIGGLRYGGQLDEQTFYRVYTKYRHTDDFPAPGPGDARDGWEMLRGGFRIDRFATPQDTLTLQGDIYGMNAGELRTVPSFVPPFAETVGHTADNSGGNLLARWTHTISPDSDFALQVYYDNLSRDLVELQYTQHTLDFEFQHRFVLTPRQEIVWGAGYRQMWDESDGRVVSLDPESRSIYLLSAFVQDDITLVRDRLHLILGTKVEHNSYTGFEIQPGARTVYTPSERHTFWGAVARAVRTPSRAERDARIPTERGPTAPGGPLFTADVLGNSDFESEDLTAYEIGYRFKPNPRMSLDVATFFNVYENLRSFDATAAPVFEPLPPPPHVLVPIAFANDLSAETYGAEVAASVMVSDNWRLQASYTLLQMHVHGPGTGDLDDAAIEGSSAQNQFQIRSYYDLTPNLQFNALLFYVDSLAGQDVGSYLRADLNLAWRPKENMTVMFGVQNLFDDRHREFGGDTLYDQGSEIPRTYFARLTWQY